MNKAVIKIKTLPRRLVAVLLLTFLLFGIVVVAADTGGSLDVVGPGGTGQSADSGISNGGQDFAYRMGLTTCFNEEVVYEVGSDEAKAAAVQDYAAKYYMTAQGETVLEPMEGASFLDLNQRNGSTCTLAGGSPAGQALKEVASMRGGKYVQSTDTGFTIPAEEEIVTELMNDLASLGPKNAALVERWKQEKYSEELAKHPVVIVVEIVGHVVGDGEPSWWSCADYASRLGFGSRFLSTDLTQYGSCDYPATSYSGAGTASTTCNALAQMGGYAGGTSEGDNWPYRYHKRFFDCSYKNVLHGSSEGNGFSNMATAAWQTRSAGGQNAGINGCTVVTVGGDISDIYGVYTWHINATRLPANAQGYQEDNVAEADGEKNIGVGAVNIKQSNLGQWREWIQTHGTGTYVVDIKKYWVVGGNFSVEYPDVVNKRISSSTNTLSSGADGREYPMSPQVLMSYLKGGQDLVLDINGMESGALDVLGGSPLGDQYRVSYATTVDVIAPDGAVVTLQNTQTHFAIYGDDSDKTYKFDQILLPGKSQVKQGDSGLDSEEYEAMSGTPTTKDLFVTQGGEQFLVKLQYRYVDETYVRNYQLKSGDGKPTYHNFMYYKTLGEKDGQASDEVEGTSHSKKYDHTCDNCDGHLTTTKMDNCSKSACKKALSDFEKAVTDFLSANNIDNNANEETDFDSNHYRDCYPDIKSASTKLDDAKTAISALSSNNVTRTTGTDSTSGWYDSGWLTMADADDMDSNKSGAYKVRFRIWQVASHSVNHDSGTEDQHTGSCSGNETTACTDPECHYGDDYHTLTSDNFKSTWKWKIEIENDVFSEDEKILKYDDTLKQQYVNTRYLDIVECGMWRMSKGRQVGMLPILAEPTEAVLEAAVEQMGYCYYDSTQTNAREWNAARKQWESEEVNDLNETGRLLNSYNDKTVEIELPGGASVKIVEYKDNFIVEYSMDNGGRSHYSYEAYFARIAGQMFYEDSTGNNPRANFIFCSSDVYDMITGNSSSNGHETFCFYQFNTEDVKDVSGLEQWLMAKENNIFVKMRDKTFVKGDKSGDVLDAIDTQGTFMDHAYLEGKVELSKMDSDGAYATTYNKAYMAEDNPYTFYKNIPDIGGITWVGYRGDYMTDSNSHVPELKCISDWTPELSSAIMKEEWKGYTWLEDESCNKNTLDSDVASAGSEFPHKEGLNVNRTQENNKYATGYAAVLYDKAVSIDHTQLAGVLPLAIMYTGANIDIQDTQLNNTSPGCAIRATYDDYWETPNDIVVFNPSTAESAQILKLSEYMPDLAGDGGDNSTYPVRDQRVNGYHVNTGQSNGIFTEDGSIASSTDYIPVSKYKRLLSQSKMATSYYDIDKDYNFVDNSTEKHSVIGLNGIWTAPSTEDYTLQVYDSQGMCTAVRIRLEEGEQVRNVGGTLYKVSKKAVVTWDDYIMGYNTSYEVENPYMIRPTRIDSYHLTELSDIKAGDVLHLRYCFEDFFVDSTKPFDVDLVISDSTAIETKYVHTNNGHTWDYYVEFKKDCSIERINVTFNVNTKLEKLKNNEYMFEFIDSLIMSTGDVYSNPPTASNTIDFVCMNNTCCVYNELLCSHVEETYTPSAIDFYKGYVSYNDGSSQYVLKQSSSDNPHIVYNRNWKYYVVGWKTNTGETIKSPRDELLDKDETVLKWNSKGETITVGELKNTACLVKYNGSVYLTTREAGLEHKIMQASMTVTCYDTFTFAGQAETPSFLSIDENISRYPLKAGATGRDLYKDHHYEFFFQLSSGAGSDGILYDVQYADNLVYKFSQNDRSTVLDIASNLKENWEYDWEEVEVQLDSNEIGLHRVDFDTDAAYLSLDDEFTVHYDNIGNYYETDHHNSGSMNVDMGYGWTDGMNTITWIQSKYAQFPFDVYTFGKSSYGTVDPSVTYQEFMSDSLDVSKHLSGTTIELTLHPAGAKIPLGYYEGDSGEADNEGHFIDFGSNSGYDYSFWVCLSSNEGNTYECVLNSVNINVHGDEEANKQPNNKDVPSSSYWRHANAMRMHIVSIVGRIGNLTMLDTGDYRFSDTFKTTDNNADWLVYKLIKKLSPYSNTYGVASTQRKLLLDPWDVRGRGGMPNLLPSGYTGYTGYNHQGYSTYRTQWHKVGDNTTISTLPLTAAFNDHPTLQMTQQKIGYANLLTLDSIGNYSGSNGQFVSSNEKHNSGIVNENGDWGDCKIQIRPYYIAIDLENDESYPVDVWMRTNTGYEKINSGSTSAKNSLTTLYNNHYNYYLDSNTEEEDLSNRTYRLDQNMLRRMVTDLESKITYNVVKSLDSAETRVVSMLTNPKTLASREWDIASQYCYGNGQYLFLRARNRTYVGNNSIALKYLEGDITNTVPYQSHAQMWYFDLGLPTSAVFMREGEPYDPDNIVKGDRIYILSCVDVYALGEVWDLHYKSPVSIADIELDNETLTPDEWNPVRDKLPYLVPVTFYDTNDTTAKDDLTTEGTH